jgi:hypothetical protein
LGKIRVADGTLVDPYNPTVADVKLDVFAHSLAQLNRFTGHAKFPYSVGQHTLNLRIAMCRLFKDRRSGVSVPMQQAALAHDMSEVWFNDLASPVKRENPDYKAAEHKAGVFIMHNLSVPGIMLDNLDKYDKAIYKNERNALFPIILGTGLGDHLKPLEAEWLPGNAFEERGWREIRTTLWYEYTEFFPAYTDYIPFWKRSDYIG